MMLINSILLRERQEPCPWCRIDIDLNVIKYRMNETVIEKCPWCNRKIRITKRLRMKPRAERGIYFIVTKCLKEGSGRWK